MKFICFLLSLFVAGAVLSCEEKLDDGIIGETTYYYINSTDHHLTLSVKGGNNPIPTGEIVDSTAAPGDTFRYHSMMIIGPGSPFMSATEANDTAIIVTIRFEGLEDSCLYFRGHVSDPATDIRSYLAYNKVPTGQNANWNSYFTITKEHFSKSSICK